VPACGLSGKLVEVLIAFFFFLAFDFSHSISFCLVFDYSFSLTFTFHHSVSFAFLLYSSPSSISSPTTTPTRIFTLSYSSDGDADVAIILPMVIGSIVAFVLATCVGALAGSGAVLLARSRRSEGDVEGSQIAAQMSPVATDKDIVARSCASYLYAL